LPGSNQAPSDEAQPIPLQISASTANVTPAQKPIPVVATRVPQANGSRNDEIVDEVLAKATALALELRHAEVTLLHLMYALTMFEASRDRLKTDALLSVDKVRQVAWREMGEIPGISGSMATKAPSNSAELTAIIERAHDEALRDQDKDQQSGATVFLRNLLTALRTGSSKERVYSLFSGETPIPTEEETRQSVGAIRTQLSTIVTDLERVQKGVFFDFNDPLTGKSSQVPVTQVVQSVHARVERIEQQLTALILHSSDRHQAVIELLKRFRNWLIGLCIGLSVSFLAAALAAALTYLNFVPR
jgi:hypothetical protein